MIHLTRPKTPDPLKIVADKNCGVASRRPFYMNNLCLKISMGFPPILQAQKQLERTSPKDWVRKRSGKGIII